MKLVPVGKGDVEAVKPFLVWHVGSFANRSGGRHTPDDYWKRIETGHAQGWIAFDGQTIKGFCLTEVADDALATVRLTHCAGEDADSWLFLMDNIKAWARERGSKAIEAICRPGWERKLTGFRKTHVILEARLDG